MKKYRDCERVLPIDAFKKGTQGASRPQCRECYNAHTKAIRAKRRHEINKIVRDNYWNGTEEDREKRRAGWKKSRATHPEYKARNKKSYDPEKGSARGKAGHARRKGILVEPPYCEGCRSTNRILQMHHDDYSRPLDVRWLCPSCHKLTHIHGDVK